MDNRSKNFLFLIIVFISTSDVIILSIIFKVSYFKFTRCVRSGNKKSIFAGTIFSDVAVNIDQGVL